LDLGQRENACKATRKAPSCPCCSLTGVVSRRVSDDDLIYQSGRPAPLVYWLCRGAMLIWTREGGKRYPLRFVRAGEPFGLEALCGHPTRRASAQALTDSHVHRVEADWLQAQLAQHPPLLGQVFGTFDRTLGQLSRRLLLARYGDMEQRAAHLLYRLARDYGEERERAIRIPLKLTQARLSSLLGTQRETVGRALTNLRERGLIAGHHGQISVRDLQDLEAIYADV